MKIAVEVENVFIALKPHCGGCRVFLARGGDRRVSPASSDELEWIFDQFPSVQKVLLAGEHKEEV